MSFDARAVRAEFPVFDHRPQGFHYLDSAATGQICRAAADALLTFETQNRANVKRGIYPLAEAATEAFADARRAVADYLGVADADQVILTSGTTLGINLFAHAFGGRLVEGDAIVLSELEHHSNIVPWQLLRERTGATIRVLPVTDEGRLDLDRLEEIVTERCRVIAVTHASNVTGALTDLRRIVAVAQAVGARVLVDGAQRAPHGPLDVPGLGVDAYAISGHKMFGPTGGGALWVRGELLAELPPFLGGGEMINRVTFARTDYAGAPHRFEAGTPAIGAAIGMGAAARFLTSLDWQDATRHELGLTERLLDGLSQIPQIRVIGPVGLQGRIGVVSFEAEGAHSHDICHLLGARGVCLRGGHHCAQPLMDRFGVVATARASLAPYNDAADIDALLAGLDEVLAILR
jgi:cysteine desulfurase / selenocysteine lyase